jgi:uncharacterized protein YceH (UPF0502 family)
LNIELTLNETRVLGCLMEKSVTTPEQYPLTLNALTNACNQKSSRNPVLSLEMGLVQRTARQLEEKHLLSSKENFNSRVEKYTQRLCNTPFAEFQFSAEEFAVMCLLLLRGAQTPGELRTRGARLHPFTDNDEVAQTLQALIDRVEGPLVVRLPRTVGRKDCEYAHLLTGVIESEAADEPGHTPPPAVHAPAVSPELGARVAVLEQEMRELREIVQRLGSAGL